MWCTIAWGVLSCGRLRAASSAVVLASRDLAACTHWGGCLCSVPTPITPLLSYQAGCCLAAQAVSAPQSPAAADRRLLCHLSAVGVAPGCVLHPALQWDKQGFLNEVAAEHHLRHVDPSQQHDASKPAIPADAHVGESPAKAVLQQISSGDVPELKHVQAPQ